MWRRKQDRHHGFVITPGCMVASAHAAEFTHRLPSRQICMNPIGGVYTAFDAGAVTDLFARRHTGFAGMACARARRLAQFRIEPPLGFGGG